MFGALSHWVERRRRDRAAVAAAGRHLEEASRQAAYLGISRVISEDDAGLVDRVCYGDVKPPHRAWYRVAPDGAVVGEMTFEQDRLFGEGYWR
jgi:hypothetical protein